MSTVSQTHTAPGVYTTVTNNSFTTAPVSRFSAGILGEANKGPINTPVNLGSTADFVNTFGTSLGDGYYFADAAAILLPLTNNLWFSRVAHEYSTIELEPAITSLNTSVSAGTNKLYVDDNTVFNPSNVVSNFGDETATELFVRITEEAKETTVNASVVSIGADGTNKYVMLSSLADTYSPNALIEFSTQANAANEAESILYAYEYGSSVGTAAGTKGQYTFTFTANGTNTLNIGDIVLLEQTGLASTSEATVKSVTSNATTTIVALQSLAVSKTGAVAVPLQASYTAATVYKANTSSTVPVLWLKASSTGTWANGVNASNGLYVQVNQGSAAGTRKLSVYLNSQLVEQLDNLSTDPTSANYYTKATSNYIVVTAVDFTSYAPSLTAKPWDTSVASINAGAATGGTFSGGYNGEITTQSDWVGVSNDATGVATGAQVFTDVSAYDIYFLAAPGRTDTAFNSTGSWEVLQRELANVAAVAGAVAITDAPDYLNLTQANDWHNGAGVYSYRSRIDSTSLATFWNWFSIVDQWSTSASATKWAPPSIGALRCLAYMFNSANPWRVAAGSTFGVIPEAIATRYTKVSQAQRDASYGNGNSINPILYLNGQATIYGERTMAVAESELSVIHTNTLVHYILDGMATIGKNHTFEPNDNTLVAKLKQEFTQFLNGVQNDRGMEQYAFNIDNSAANRNARQVVVGLEIIPTEDMERMFINCAVNASGATLVTTTN